MALAEVIEAIDMEIVQLKKARALLSDEEVTDTNPAAKKTAAKKASAKTATPGTRIISPEGRARMAAAQQKRRAAQKKASK